MKLKSRSTLREKKRYIVFRIHSEEKLPYELFKSAAMDTLLEFLGERGFSQASPRLIRNLFTGRTGFILTSPRHVDAVKTSLALIHQIADSRVIIQTLKVAGTIASGKKSLISARQE